MSDKPKTLTQMTFKQIVAAMLLSLSVFGTGNSRAQTAQYEVEFDATWSSETHPYKFPSSPHFSGLIGGTHNEEVTFWERDGIVRLAPDSVPREFVDVPREDILAKVLIL